MDKPAAIAAAALAILCIRHFLGAAAPIYSDAILLLALPILVAALLGKSPRELGLRLGKTRDAIKPSLAILAISAPLILIASRFPEFYGYYPLFPWARSGIVGFLAYEALILAFMLATEFFFRGFIMLGLKGIGKTKANMLQTALYALLHFGKPWPEIPASLIGGLLFGWLDQKAESVLPSTLLHFSFSLLMDIFCLQAASLVH